MLGRISFASGSIQMMSDAEQNHTCLGGAEKDLSGVESFFCGQTMQTLDCAEQNLFQLVAVEK